MDVETVVQARQPGDDGGQQIGRHGGDDADAQPAGQQALRGAGEIAQFVHRPQDLAHTRQELLAEHGEPHLARTPLDEPCAERVLQILHLQRQGGLRDGASIRGTAEMPVTGQRLEIAELLEGQIIHRFI